MDSEEINFDALYNQILQQGRGIDPLFNSLFSFLRRRTDFYKNSDAGFTSIEKHFKLHKLKFDQEQEKERLKKEKERKAQEAKKQKEQESQAQDKSAVKEISKEEFERRKQEELKKSQPVQSNPPEPDSHKEQELKEEQERKAKLTQMDEELRRQLLKNTEGLEDKNGGRSRHYTWNQPQVELFEMLIPVEQSVKGSQIRVEYDSKHLKVMIKGEYVVNGELFAPINADSFIWTLDEINGRKVIVITFDKLYKLAWWDYAVKGDDILSLSKVNPDPSKLSDLDPSMRPEIEKMMWENSMKMQGKPFHKDPKTNDMLQKFMKEHPEMDFSKAQIN